MLPVVILAGGLATRLRPVTERIPKSLVEIDGEPFLAHQLRLLRAAGIRRVVLCVGHLGEMIETYAGDGRGFGMDIDYSNDGAVLRGTAGAIAQALPLAGDTFFVLYGDSYLPCDYAVVERAFLKSGRLALMTVYQNRGQWDSSNIWFEDGRILAYDKKLHTPEMHYIDYGLGVFYAAAFDSVPRQGPSDLANLYGRLLNDGALAGFKVDQRFYEVGSFQGIQDLSAYLARRKFSGSSSP